MVYSTLSILSEENEAVVQHCINCVNGELTLNKSSNYVLSPPVLPLNLTDLIGDDSAIQRKCIQTYPSSAMHGCFVAVITKEVIILVQ